MILQQRRGIGIAGNHGRVDAHFAQTLAKQRELFRLPPRAVAHPHDGLIFPPWPKRRGRAYVKNKEIQREQGQEWKGLFTTMAHFLALSAALVSA